MIKKYMERKFSKRDSKEFNFARAFFQKIVCNWTFGLVMRMKYKFVISGKENLKTDRDYIIAANHLANSDPFMLVYALQIPVAYMAKEELFGTFWSRVLMDFCGAFSVNRDKLEVSTIKTAIAVKKSKWKLGIFPQGTRSKTGNIENLARGFVALAKTSKCDILPVGINGTETKGGFFKKGVITINVGELIPCGDDLNETVDKWGKAVSELSGFPYVVEEKVNA